MRNKDRRKCERYPLTVPIRYRVAQRHAPPLTGGGTTFDMSPAGVSFLCRDTLPVGSHIEMMAQWPVRRAGRRPLELRMTGFVVRSNESGAAVRVTSHRLCDDEAAEMAYAASA